MMNFFQSQANPRARDSQMIFVDIDSTWAVNSLSAGNDFAALLKTLEPSLENLEMLTRLHFLTFSFEHTAMYLYYTADHTMDVSAEGAFKRLVIDGSYCFGQNGVFLDMLHGLEYRAYSGAAKENITPGSVQTYIIDVGFGSIGIVRPILLSENSSGRNTIKEASIDMQKTSFVESRHVLLDDAGPGLDEEWKREVAPERGQYKDEAERMFMFKYVMMGNEVKRNVGRSSVTIGKLTMELQRIRALREIFGLDVPDEEEIYIKGWSSALN
ncbi:hypothetical protein Hypma_002790 [Hypsizygus marmoreus]|uniref:Uncharacterized protein n=1 Tax=Hypsizygus marmoreus TaxID=39966 RepID=A0A369J3K6_HYPMA|nr:hypothetical protein Hypma_002790 [Hypsizygus marmoreus]